MAKNGRGNKRSKRNHAERKYAFDDQEVVRTVGEDIHTYNQRNPLEAIESSVSNFGAPSRRKTKIFFVAIGIIGLIAGGVIAAVLSVSMDSHRDSQFEEAESEKIEVVKDQVIKKLTITPPVTKIRNTTTANTTMATTTTVTTPTTTEACNENWTEWSEWASCSDRGAGPYQKRRGRSKFDSAACARDGHTAEYQWSKELCDYTGPNAVWGTGKYNI